MWNNCIASNKSVTLLHCRSSSRWHSCDSRLRSSHVTLYLLLLLLPVCVTLLLQQYRFLLRPSHGSFPCLLSSKCMWDVCWCPLLAAKRISQIIFLSIPPRFVSWPSRAIPSPYSQVSASLFKISQLFVRRGEWSLALGRKAPSGWMAKSEGGHRAASHISLKVVFLHCCKSYFSSLTSVFLHIHRTLATRLVSYIQNGEKFVGNFKSAHFKISVWTIRDVA